ncbi:helix-turn-helix domain-containing protein [Niveibacterium microcysteis]|uniref:AraC family transcriptional regulator ligand-binding domain-containing protein n=1 Tax=Niveibacterium microcysteis TaxID=2811415 RepID=A0ABX7M9A2_9RHOO|nr:AraC family transcriptional regulator ligand-binding domain-containing protein [Niveibacterium microcysteis]QSI77323.1 AraC family transcriptional regulator ligand-binding domain-containing protein [Niveibacterium microcysteis]
MSENQEYVPQMRHFQALFTRYRDDTDRLAVLQSRFGLQRVAPSDTTPFPAESALQMSEWLHAAGDPHAFAWLAGQLDMGAGDGLVYYLRAHDTLQAALDELARLAPVLFPDGSFRWASDGHQLTMVLVPVLRPERLGRRQRYESILVWLVRVLDYICGVRLPVLHAEVMTEDAGDPATLAALLGVTPRMGATTFSLTYAADVLKLHLPGASEALRQTIRPMYERELTQMLEHTSAVRRVAGWLAALPDLGGAGLDSAAAALAMGASTLRRQLAAEGCRFSTLLAAHRARLALDAVLCTDEKAERLALRMGYADRSSFERGFCDRFGVRPAQVRRAAQELIGARRCGDWGAPQAWPRHSPKLDWLRQVLAEGGAGPALVCDAFAADPVLQLRLLGLCGEPVHGARESAVIDSDLLARMPRASVQQVVESSLPAEAPTAEALYAWRCGALAARAVGLLAPQLAPDDAAALRLAAFAHNLGRLAAPAAAGRAVDGIDATWLLLATWHVPPAILGWLRERHAPASAAGEALALAVAWAEAVLAGAETTARCAVESQIAARASAQVCAELAAIARSVVD